MVTTSERRLVLLTLLVARCIHGFNVCRTTAARRQRVGGGGGGGGASMPPLYYTDVEPEIGSITVPPPSISDMSSSTVTHDEENRLSCDAVVTRRGGALSEESSRWEEGATASRWGPASAKTTSATTTTTTSSTTTKSNRSVVGGRKRIGASSDDVSSRASHRTSSRRRPDDVEDASPAVAAKSYKPHKTAWLTRYNELKAYRDEHGHCMPPQSYPSNPKLGLWVMQQRRLYALKSSGRNTSFDGPDGSRRMRLLEDIGFVWRVERGGRPRGSYKGLRRTRYRRGCDGDGDGNDSDALVNDADVAEDDIFDAVDFEGYMIAKRREYTDEDVRDAWRRRYEYFR